MVFRLRWAPTIRAAHQLVVHGHVQINGRRLDRPAAMLAIGHAVTLSARARRMPGVRLPSYLERDPADPFAGRVVGRPTREDIPLAVDEAAIVEFYAR